MKTIIREEDKMKTGHIATTISKIIPLNGNSKMKGKPHSNRDSLKCNSKGNRKHSREIWNGELITIITEICSVKTIMTNAKIQITEEKETAADLKMTILM
jgi:hypothetical protein